VGAGSSKLLRQYIPEMRYWNAEFQDPGREQVTQTHVLKTTIHNGMTRPLTCHSWYAKARVFREVIAQSTHQSRTSIKTNHQTSQRTFQYSLRRKAKEALKQSPSIAHVSYRNAFHISHAQAKPSDKGFSMRSKRSEQLNATKVYHYHVCIIPQDKRAKQSRTKQVA
jgi:hypothetical protein